MGYGADVVNLVDRSVHHGYVFVHHGIRRLAYGSRRSSRWLIYRFIVIRLAGVPVKKRLVLELAIMLRRSDYAHTADTLEGATVTNQADVPLTVADRIAILNVLEDPPEGLEELRATLLEGHVWRQREGLV
jgi:hypothetical protein